MSAAFGESHPLAEGVRASLTRPQVPSFCHSSKYQKAVFQCGRSAGSARHVHALPDDVHDGVEDRATGVLGRPAARPVGRDQGFEDGPLGVGEAGVEGRHGRLAWLAHARYDSGRRVTHSSQLPRQALSSAGADSSHLMLPEPAW